LELGIGLLHFRAASKHPQNQIKIATLIGSTLWTKACFSLVYPEEGSIVETSVKILIITASVLEFLNLH